MISKLFILITALMVLFISIAYADYITADPTIRKAIAYGDYNGSPVKLKVDADGVLQV